MKLPELALNTLASGMSLTDLKAQNSYGLSDRKNEYKNLYSLNQPLNHRDSTLLKMNQAKSLKLQDSRLFY